VECEFEDLGGGFGGRAGALELEAAELRKGRGGYNSSTKKLFFIVLQPSQLLLRAFGLCNNSQSVYPVIHADTSLYAPTVTLNSRNSFFYSWDLQHAKSRCQLEVLFQ
jgi:hypothetical protein